MQLSESDAPRANILDEAKNLIMGDRNIQYDEPTHDFLKSVGILSALGYTGPRGRDLQPHDIAVIAIAIKLSRITWSPDKRDHWTDICGYGACGYECTVKSSKKE